MPTVVCLGILVVDVIGRPIERVPAPGTLELVESITPHIGGCAANTGIGLQKLGVDAIIAGAVGQDGFGNFLQKTLRDYGANTKGVVEKSDVPTSSTMVLVGADGERAFLHCVGANAALVGDDFDESLLDGAQILHIAGHGLMPSFDGAQCAEILQLARAKGIKTSLDTAGAPNEKWCNNLRLTLPYLDYFVPSLHEVRALLPDCQTPEAIAERLIEMGVGTVAIKMGEKGSYARNKQGETARAEVFPVQVVDTTGAGDAFAAGFLAASLRGLPLETCLKMGNAAGACCVQQVGTIAGLRDWDETFALLESA